MTAATDGEQPRPRHELVNLLPVPVGDALVAVTVNHQGRAADAAREIPHVAATPAVAGAVHHRSRSRPAVAHAVLERLGRVRFREDRQEEPVQVFRPVGPKQLALGANPFGHLRVLTQRLGEPSRDDEVRNPLGMLGREAQRGHGGHRDAHHDLAGGDLR